MSRDVDLETTPLYVRAGAILPMGPLRQYTEEKIDGPISLNIHAGADGEFELYEDDGLTFEFEKGAVMRVLCRWSDKERVLRLELIKGSRMMPTTSRKVEVRLVPEGKSRAVTFEGRPLSVQM